jgi:hypothetical protein
MMNGSLRANSLAVEKPTERQYAETIGGGRA